MKYILSLYLLCFFFQPSSCQEDNKNLAAFFKEYTEENYKIFPLVATYNGDTRYNDQLPIDFTDSYVAVKKKFYSNYLDGIKKFDRNRLNDNDKISYDIFKRDMEIALEGQSYPTNRIPFNQFGGLQFTLGQLGAGTGAQPFKTVKDYENWLNRAQKFGAWADSAIVYFKKGIEENFVLPKSLVVKMIPQLQALQKDDVTQSVFYGPVNKFPEGFSEADKKRLTEAFK